MAFKQWHLNAIKVRALLKLKAELAAVHKSYISELQIYKNRETTKVKFVCFMFDKVATLLRVATMEDHIFLLSHVLRCPAGIAAWSCSYVQPVPPVYSSRDPSTSFGSVLLDHFVTMFAMVVQPVRSVWSLTEPLISFCLNRRPLKLTYT